MSADVFQRLSAPFPPDRVSWRVGSTTADKKRGLALAYIDARDVMERLDEVLGPQSWQCRYPHANGKTVCEIGLYSVKQDGSGEWIWKADGAGDTDVEAEKGALSDAFKRAAVRWGIGRYLYDLESVWVELEPRGRSYAIKESEYPRLRKLLGGAEPPAPKAEPQPAQPDSKRDEFIASVITDIDRLEDEILIDQSRLNTWWESVRTECADFGLELADINQLKLRLIARRDAPKKGKKAA